MSDRLTAVARMVHEALTEPIPFDVGARARWEHAAPPRVVWVLASDAFAGPHQAGGQNPSRMTLRRSVDLYIWHRSLEEADALESALVEALWRTCAGSLEVTGAVWLTQEEASWLTMGEAVRLTIVLMMPVISAPAPTAPIRTVSATTVVTPRSP